jgi:hypothetical protein
VRFADLAPADAEAFLAGDADVTVEFRDGDRLPLGLKVGGDLLATSGDGAAVLRVQRTFFVRRADGGVELSLDGVAFAPWGDLVTGFLRANASSSDGARVDRLEVESEVRLRPDTP